MSGNKILKNPIKIYQQTELQNGKNNTIKQKIRVRNYHTVCISIKSKKKYK